MQNLQSLLGIFALLAIAWTVSEDRRAVAWKQAGIGLLATFATAVVMLKLPGATRVFGAINEAVDAISAASRAGTSFVFGYLGGGQLPFELKTPGAEFVLALQALPVVLVMSVLTTLPSIGGSCRRLFGGFPGCSSARST
jgi:CNT family concentrative nucleoside transporter